MLVDDHPVVRAGVTALLDASEVATLVAVCEHPADAVARAVELRPDVILLDFVLQDANGFDVARELGRRGVDARLVMFTGHDHGVVLAKSAIGEGFYGYLNKRSVVRDLERCLAAVARGEYWMNGPAETVTL
jgi:DNA-binding NarL/FixJ family response regulator